MVPNTSPPEFVCPPEVREAIRNAVGEADWDAERAIGREQTLDALVALADVLAATLAAQPADPPRAAAPDGLTAREVEVLRLIVEGKSNRAIAAALTLSVNTVFQHVRSILGKTGAANRTEAAAYALRRGLAE